MRFIILFTIALAIWCLINGALFATAWHGKLAERGQMVEEQVR